ncbi:hypothetical protein ACJJTC_002162 [Scirpophaga incertulas]
MEDFSDIISKISAPTDNIQITVLQEVLLKSRQNSANDGAENFWCCVTDILWEHLSKGFKNYDDQLLCATCFYAALSFKTQQSVYLSKVLLLINNEINSRKNLKQSANSSKISQVMSLMYGMFQSMFLICNRTIELIEEQHIEEFLTRALDLLIVLCYEYSKYTFLAFKTIYSFKKILSTKFQNIVYTTNNIKRLLNLVNHNWENPINGVRDLNKQIFKCVIEILDQDTYNIILSEVNTFTWNKAKYLMFAEVIGLNYKNVLHATDEKELKKGSVYSLHKPGLVSAGADMYYAIINSLNSEEEWCNIFQNDIIEILKSNDNKAIENFSNYWCLPSFKKFPSLVHVLLDDLLKLDETEQTLYSYLCLLKQGSKLGYVTYKYSNKSTELVLEALEHWNTCIRMLAFEIISTCNCKHIVTYEYDLILDYIANNINSDCTVLRINLLNNIKYFMTKTEAILSVKSKSENQNTKELLGFYIKLQEVFIHSINLNGNYQRKITTLKLCNIFLCVLNEDVPRKRQHVSRKTQSHLFTFLNEHNGLLLFNLQFMLKVINFLKDPADDIRETTIQILQDHYTKEISSQVINNLIEDAKSAIQSKFFFQISCGQTIFKLLSNLCMKGCSSDGELNSLDDIFFYIYEQLKTEHKLKQNIVESIETGKQLHSLLGVLIEVLKVSKQNSYNIHILNEELPQLLDILEDISKQFTCDEESTSSDFSKMNDMIQNIIVEFGYNPYDRKDQTKISGLQQIVLNCLWFNVKAACDLASFLIQLLEDDQYKECEKCLRILMHVLETSRHKGVIEAAGAALGRAIQCLTALPEDSALSKIPLALLESKIKELITYANMASVTRRGAGLSIMVHRIVSSDMKKGKPLFHYFMGTLLESCNNTNDLPNSLNKSEKDVPKAIYIHFLTRIVTDSSLASETMYYSVELAEIAFSNLTSSHWQIRNAALQLYGALIPKLIGQKKASGPGIETIATVACDEFSTHSPKLWGHMKGCLKAANTGNKIQAQSNVMPVLNVMANFAKRYNFSFDTGCETNDGELLKNLTSLLGSPILTIRRLTAKCIYNIYDIETIYRTLADSEIKHENFLHGALILVTLCHKHYSMKNKSNEKQYNLNELKIKFDLVLSQGNHSYVCRQQYEELLDDPVQNIDETLAELQSNIYAPGVHYWAKCRLIKCIRNSPWEKIFQVLNLVSKQRDFDEYCNYVLNKLESDNVSEQYLRVIHSAFQDVQKSNRNNVTWAILFHISSRVKCYDNLLPENILTYIENPEFVYKTRNAIPYLASIAELLPGNMVEILSSIILSLSDPEKADVDKRYIAALANNEYAKIFTTLGDTIKLSCMKSLVMLLQDEDEDVRSLSTCFYMYLVRGKKRLHPYMCLHKIFNKEFFYTYLNDPKTSIKMFCEEIDAILESYESNDMDEYNPFSSICKNIYFEINVVKQLLSRFRP